MLSKRATNKCLHSGETPNRTSDSLICTAQHTVKGQAKRPSQHCRSRGHADCAGAVAHVFGTRHVYKTLRMQRPSPQAATVCSSGCFVRRRVQHNQIRHLPHRRSCLRHSVVLRQTFVDSARTRGFKVGRCQTHQRCVKYCKLGVRRCAENVLLDVSTQTKHVSAPTAHHTRQKSAGGAACLQFATSVNSHTVSER